MLRTHKSKKRKLAATPIPVSRVGQAQKSSLRHVFLYHNNTSEGFRCIPRAAQFPINVLINSFINFILLSRICLPFPVCSPMDSHPPSICHLSYPLHGAGGICHGSFFSEYTIRVSPLWLLIFYETSKNILSLKHLLPLRKGSQSPRRLQSLLVQAAPDTSCWQPAPFRRELDFIQYISIISIYNFYRKSIVFEK